MKDNAIQDEVKKNSSGSQMGPIMAFIWEVEILWWRRNSNLLKKLELDFF